MKKVVTKNILLHFTFSAFLLHHAHFIIPLPLIGQAASPLTLKMNNFWPLPDRENSPSKQKFSRLLLASAILHISDISVNTHFPVQLSMNPGKNIMPHSLIDQVIINYGEIEKQKQQRHTLSNQTGSSLNFNSIICQNI